MVTSAAPVNSVNIKVVSINTRVDKSGSPYKEILDNTNKKWYAFPKFITPEEYNLFAPGNMLKIEYTKSTSSAIPKIKTVSLADQGVCTPSIQSSQVTNPNSSISPNSVSSVDKCKYRTEALSLSVHLVAQGVLDRNNMLLEADVFFAYIMGDISHEPAKIASYLGRIKG